MVRGSFHFHGFWQAEMAVSGHIRVRFADQEVTLGQHRALVIPPGVRHGFDYVEDDTEYFSFKYGCQGAESITRPLLFEDDANIIPLRHYVQEFLASDQRHNHQAPIHIQNAIKTLLEIELLTATELPSLTITEQIEQHIHANSGAFPTAEEIAEKMGFSRPHLSKLVKNESGRSLKPFMDAVRLKQAKSMLELSDLSISEISTLLGFSDLYGFSKFFRRLAQTSPRDYRHAKRTTFANQL